MDRRDFIRQALITALASGPLQTLSRSGTAWASDDPVCGLPGGYCYGLYDNFDGEGGLNPDTGEHLAREGEFSPSLWRFYRRASEITHMDDLNDTGKATSVPVDDDGIPAPVYRDPALAMITKYLVGERPGEDRLYDITPLLDGVALSVLHGESDPPTMVQQLLAQPSIFSPEGEVAAQYLRTGDLWLLQGMSSWTLETIQKIRRLSGYSRGQGPSRVRYLERGFGGQEREAGSIGLVPKDEVDRKLAQSKRSKEDRVLPVPRRVTGRRKPIDLRAKPYGYVVKMENSTGVDMRLELTNPSKIDFAHFHSWSADLMLDSRSTSPDFICALDFHTSIPEQPPGISWLYQMGIIRDPRAQATYIFAQGVNKNTGWQVWQNFGHVRENSWYNVRFEMLKISENELTIDHYINGKSVGDSVTPPDSEILLDPSRVAFGPIRSVECAGDIEYNEKAVVYLDNFRSVYVAQK